MKKEILTGKARTFSAFLLLASLLGSIVGAAPRGRPTVAASTSFPSVSVEPLGRPRSGAPTTGTAKDVKPYSSIPTRDAVKWADKQLNKMSLDEKIGQLISVGINATFLNQDSDAYRALKHQVEDNHVGGIILFRGPVYESVVLVNRMQQLARYPLLISADLEAGAGMRFDDTVNFPWNMAVAATGNPEYARRQGEVTAREARALGVLQIYAPVVDVNNNAANPVINVRSYGEDPADVARFAAAFTEGAQRLGVIATAKHFPGHGDTTADSHHELPVVEHPPDRIERVEAVPFKAAIEANVAGIMTAHVLIPALDDQRPATMSPRIVDGMLKQTLGFQGMVVTDDLDMKAISAKYGTADAAVAAIAAGCDVVLLCGPDPAAQVAALEALVHAVEDGTLPLKRVEDALLRHRRVKERFLAPPRPMPLAGTALRTLLGRDEHQVVAAEMARFA